MDSTVEAAVGDPLERQIFRYTAMSITEELEVNITRTAYSLLIQEAQDYCISLLTPDFLPYAYSEASIPIFFPDMGEPIRDAVSVIGAHRLEDGDVFVTNYATGQHLNNVMLGVPLFHGERLTGYLAIKAHWADVGGLTPGGQTMSARAIFQEGTRYRGLFIMKRGEIVPEMLATIQANTWQISELTGDLQAQLAACMLGARRWKERMVSRWSADEVQALAAAQLESSAAYARRAIAKIPDGVYTAEHRWDYKQAGERVELDFKIKLVVEGSRLICDFSDFPPQSHLPINAGVVGGATAAARLAFRYFLDDDAPSDAGLFEPIEIIAPEGRILSASPEAPLGNWNATISLTIDLFIRAIGNALPDLVPASHFGTIGGISMRGVRSDGSRWWTFEAALGGLGAQKDRDGYGPVKALYLGNMKSIPIEMQEAKFPLRYHERSLDWEAGGEGLHRGGPAVDLLFETLEEISIEAYASASEPAPGLAGGKQGRLDSLEVKLPGSEDWGPLPVSAGGGWASIPAGTLIRQKGGGGGGWGTPEDQKSHEKMLHGAFA